MYLVEFERPGKGFEGRFLYLDKLSFDVVQ